MTPRPIDVRPLVLAVSLLFGASCGDKTKDIVNPPLPHPPTLSFVSGLSASDTIDATIALPLVIRIARGDTTLRGVRVTFTTRVPSNTTRTGLRVAAKPFQSYDASADDTTGIDGTATARVRLGTLAAPAYIIVAAPALGLVDSTLFTVLPGRGWNISVGPLDTAVFASSALRLRVSSLDRVGNPTRDWRFQILYDGVTTADGDSVVRTGPDYMRTNFVVTSKWGGAGTNVRLTIVPRDTMMVERYASTPNQFKITYQTMGMDGSSVRMLDSTANSQFTGPRWLPDGRVMFSDTTGLIAVNATGVRTKIMSTAQLENGSIFDAVPSRAGDWIFYVLVAAGRESIWRVRVDGSGAEQLAANVLIDGMDVTPDGRSLIVGRALGTSIERFDIQTRTFTKLGVAGRGIRLSPQGDRIAFTTPDYSALRVVNIDGTDARDIVRTPISDAQLNWSNDGQLVLAATQAQGPYVHDAYHFFRVSNGEKLPLPFAINGTNGYGEVAIKPQ